MTRSVSSVVTWSASRARAEAFGGSAGAAGTADFQALEVVTESIATTPRDAGYAMFTDFADAGRADCDGHRVFEGTRFRVGGT